MLRPFTHPVACCCATFETGQTFQSTTPKISFVPWSLKRSATMLDVGATHAQYAWFTKTCGLYPSHDALQVPTLYWAVLITVRVDLSAFYRATFTPVRLKVSNCDDVGRHVKKCPKTHTILRKTSWSSKFIAFKSNHDWVTSQFSTVDIASAAIHSSRFGSENHYPCEFKAACVLAVVCKRMQQLSSQRFLSRLRSSWLRPTAEDVSAFGQHRKFLPYARITSGTQRTCFFVFLCFSMFSLFFLMFSLFSSATPCFPMFPLFFYVLPGFTMFSYVIPCFSRLFFFSSVFLCFCLFSLFPSLVSCFIKFYNIL